MDLVITGICRSGTTLFHKLINDCIPNAVSTNELVNGIENLKSYFSLARADVNAGREIANRYARNGVLTDNSWRKGAEIQRRLVDKPTEGDWLLATKVLVGFVDRMEDLIKTCYPIVAIVRDPIYTLGSWGDPKTKDQTVGRIGPGNPHPWWSSHPFDFDAIEEVGRRAEYWNHLAGLINAASSGGVNKFLVIRYEDLVADPEKTLNRFLQWLGIKDKAIGVPKLTSSNRDDRYPVDMSKIRKAVIRYAHNRERFGYGG